MREVSMAPYGLDDFIDELKSVVAEQLEPQDALEKLSPGFKKLLGNRTFLSERLAKIPVQDYETCLYRDPEYEFVILARGVKPRNSPYPILPHDHGPLWALYGVYDGRVRMERYEVRPDSHSGPYPGLALTAARNGVAGDFDAILPGHLHCPPDEEDGSLTIVVYPRDLDEVRRRGYVPTRKALVEFQGKKPPRDQMG
jgi:hypothetical protein